MPVREQAFLSWAGLRGAVPIVLATIPLAEGVEGASSSSTGLVFVIVFTLLQAPTLPFVARRLGLADDASAGRSTSRSHRWQISADLLQVRIPPESRLAGVEVGELRLPGNVVVSLIIRDERPFAPGRVRADQGRRRAAGGDARGGPGQNRVPAPGRQPRRSARPLAYAPQGGLGPRSVPQFRTDRTRGEG